MPGGREAQSGAQIQSVGPQNIAQVTLGLKGGDVPQAILVPNLLGTIELGRRTEAELLFEQDILPWACRWHINNAVGQFGVVDIVGPEESIIVIQNVYSTLQQNINYSLRWTNTAVVGGQPIASRDMRFGLFPASGARVPTVNANVAAAIAAVNNNIWQVNGNTALAAHEPMPPIVLFGRDPSGNHLQWVCEGANLAVDGGMWGYSVRRRVG